MKAYDYRILQMKDGDALHFLRWSNWVTYQKMTGRKTADRNHYEEVYNEITLGENDKEVLEKIFYVFNMDRPTNFRGHSLTAGDIVVLNGKAYYCDSVGWVRVAMRGEKKHA